MGQKQTERSSDVSSQSLLKTVTTNNHSGPPTSPAPMSSPFSHDGSPYARSDNEITPPAPARVLNRLSEIIDPRDLIQDELYLMTPTRHGSSSQPMPFTFRGLVQSPSGNELGAEEFIAHPNRPLAMWERQERVLQATRDRLEMLEMELQAARQSDNDMRSDNGTGSHNDTRLSPSPQRKSRSWWRCGCLC